MVNIFFMVGVPVNRDALSSIVLHEYAKKRQFDV